MQKLQRGERKTNLKPFLCMKNQEHPMHIPHSSQKINRKNIKLKKNTNLQNGSNLELQNITHNHILIYSRFTLN